MLSFIVLYFQSIFIKNFGSNAFNRITTRSVSATLLITMCSVLASKSAFSNECERSPVENSPNEVMIHARSAYQAVIATLKESRVTLSNQNSSMTISGLTNSPEFKNDICSDVMRLVRDELPKHASSSSSEDEKNEAPTVSTNSVAVRLSYIKDVLISLFNNTNIIYTDDESVRTAVKIGLQSLLKPDFKLNINIGFGGTMDPLNVRTPAYIIAGAELMEHFLTIQDELKKHGLSFSLPKLRIFSAHNAAIYANSFPVEITQKRAKDMVSLLKAYISRFYPKLDNHVHFISDNIGFYKNEDILGLQSEFKSFLNSEDGKKISESLCKRGKNHGGEENSLFYGAIHSFIFEEICPVSKSQLKWESFYPSEANGSTDLTAEAVISIGGETEILFNRVRELLMKHVAGSEKSGQYTVLPSIRLISNAGKFPVYYTDKSEFTVDDLKAGKEAKNISSNVKKDIQIIHKDIASRLGTVLLELFETRKDLFPFEEGRKVSKLSTNEKNQLILSQLLALYTAGVLAEKNLEVKNCLLSSQTHSSLSEPIAQVFDRFGEIFKKLGYKIDPQLKNKPRNLNASLIKSAESELLKVAADDLIQWLKSL